MKGIIRIGEYEAGYERVRVVARPGGTGGSVTLLPKGGGMVEISVGLDDTWPAVARALLHEAFEFACIRLGLRFYSANTISNDATDYVFVMWHLQMSEAVALASELVLGCQKDVWRVWRKQGRGSAGKEG